MSAFPEPTRVRHEAKRRTLNVARVEAISPSMARVVLTGDALAGFTSLGFDDHVKLFFPGADGGAAPEMRDFTPRHYDSVAGELWIDFFLHEAGPAAEWIRQAQPKDLLDVGGPRSSFVLPVAGIDTHVLVGDETALPAIARRLEELPHASTAIAIVETDAGATGYPLRSRAKLDVRTLRRPDGGPAAASVIAELEGLPYAPGNWFTWVAGESHVAREIRRYLLDKRGLDKRRVKAAGYWRTGAVGTHERISDEE